MGFSNEILAVSITFIHLIKYELRLMKCSKPIKLISSNKASSYYTSPNSKMQNCDCVLQ